MEDALQNLYLKVYSDSARFKKVENKKAYVFRILCNECNDINRRAMTSSPLGIDDLHIVSPQPENFEEEFALINTLLDTLPAEQSETIRLHLHAGMTFVEIAETMGVPLPTAKARFRYGIEKLRIHLKSLNIL